LTQKQNATSSNSNNNGGSSSDQATISDGSSINYDRARQFMEYYCQRYKFGKPDLDYSQTSGAKKGKAKTTWEAVMTVGGRRIGMGSLMSLNTSRAATEGYGRNFWNIPRRTRVRAWGWRRTWSSRCRTGWWMMYMDYVEISRPVRCTATHLVRGYQHSIRVVCQGGRGTERED
jgi:hypothetical protein